MLQLNQFLSKAIRGFIECACVTYCVYEYVGDIVVCSGPSMEPTLYTNDILIMERISVRLQKLKKGDIVISKCPNNPNQNICKRIVGLPGDNIRNGLNITTIPYGYVWLEGDNSNNSTDSRLYGPVPHALLRGRAMATLRWGIVSAGRISHDFATVLRVLLADEHEIIAVAAREMSRAQNFAHLHNIPKAYNSYKKLALDENIDIVYIGTIHLQHFNAAMMMLKHGKHVLCEKPLTMNLKQTTELINYARSKELFLMEAMWSRCFPVYDAIRKELASGNIGDIHQVTVSLGHFGLTNIDRIIKKELGGGMILNFGPYCLQFACLAYNNEMPESIKASGVLNEDGVDMSMSATLLYKGNRTATILTHGLVDLPNKAHICGTNGMIKVSEFWWPQTVELPSGKLKFPLPQLKEKVNFINSAGFFYEAAEARACILQGLIESPKMTHNTSLLLAKLEDVIRKEVGVVYREDML